MNVLPLFVFAAVAVTGALGALGARGFVLAIVVVGGCWVKGTVLVDMCVVCVVSGLLAGALDVVVERGAGPAVVDVGV